MLQLFSVHDGDMLVGYWNKKNIEKEIMCAKHVIRPVGSHILEWLNETSPKRLCNMEAFLTNQNHCYMPILIACFILGDDTQNSINIPKVDIPLKWFIILAPSAKIRIN